MRRLVLVGSLLLSWAPVWGDDSSPDGARKHRSGLAAVQAMADALEADDGSVAAPPNAGDVAPRAVRERAERRRDDLPDGRSVHRSHRSGGVPIFFLPQFGGFGFPVGGGFPVSFGFTDVGFDRPIFTESFIVTGGVSAFGFVPGFFDGRFFFPPTPIVTSISAPEVTRFEDDAVERQLRSMVEGIRRSAENPGGLRLTPSAGSVGSSSGSGTTRGVTRFGMGTSSGTSTTAGSSTRVTRTPAVTSSAPPATASERTSAERTAGSPSSSRRSAETRPASSAPAARASTPRSSGTRSSSASSSAPAPSTPNRSSGSLGGTKMISGANQPR